ncbi:hypothetical protein ACS8E3_12070 [Psychrobacter sp. 2Y5]|uniref:hypothetical protein n=1 Tax=unclassified Psychrobacter TaxID=196806 RepID=UPI003F454258
MIDGIWWLVILLSVVAALWLLAKARGAKVANGASANKLPKNDALQKTVTLLKNSFPEYQVSRKAKHLLVSRQGKKVAMITIDNSIAAGQRRLGEVPIINYHRAPSRELLAAHLADAE